MTDRSGTMRALIMGSLAVAILDGGFVVVRVLLNGGNVSRPFQSIAAGLLGAPAYDGGALTALLGVALHFVVAAGVVLVYFAASRHWPGLTRHPVLVGALYGLLVYAVMNFVVIPLSALSAGPRSLGRMIPGILIHIVGVGIPAAMTARAALARTPAGDTPDAPSEAP